MLREKKIITIDQFMKLWEYFWMNDLSKIVKLYPKKVMEVWKAEIVKRFNDDKSSGSYDELLDWQNMALKFQMPEKTKGYNAEYMAIFPTTYVKFGDLYEDMNSPRQYTVDVKKDPQKMRVIIEIPLKKPVGGEEIDEEGYQWLEASRSYIRASFLQVWPKILKELLLEIVDIK